MNVNIIGELRDIRDSLTALIDYMTDERASGKATPDEGCVIELREGTGCQCTGDELPNVQDVTGGGISGKRYACTGCGQEITDVGNRKVVS